MLSVDHLENNPKNFDQFDQEDDIYLDDIERIEIKDLNGFLAPLEEQEADLTIFYDDIVSRGLV